MKLGLHLVDAYRSIRKKCGKPAVPAKRLLNCRKLHPGKDPEEVLRQKDAAFAEKMLIMAAVLAVAAVAVFAYTPAIEALTGLVRPESGDGDAVYELEAVLSNGESVEVEVTLKERSYTEDEAMELFEAAYAELAAGMLGGNESLSYVTSSLYLADEAADGAVSVSWQSSDRDIISDFGEIAKEQDEIDSDGETCTLTASLACGEYSTEVDIEVTVYPAQLSYEEALAGALLSEVEEAALEDLTGSLVALPSEYNGMTVSWYEVTDGSAKYWVLVLLAAAAVCLAAHERQKEKDELELRSRELAGEYPEFVSGFTVLIQAGMTTRNAWERMVMEYEKRDMERNGSGYVYEEMKTTLIQLKNGAYESKVYSDFGMRCGLHQYIKFGALLEQELKQGTAGLSTRLGEEVHEALQERKNLARRQGEEAETKLMLPMIMMLIVVLIVVMTPAFLSF